MIAGPSWFDWAVHEPYFWAGERLVKAGIPIAKRMIRPRPAANWLARLNAALVRDGLVRVRAHARLPPQVTLDPLGLDTTTLDALVAVHRASLEGPNDVVTVLCQEPTWNDTPIRIRAAPLEYAAVCALDSLGKRPVMLSGNALLVCAETREILLHRRSDSSRDYARALHTFGGACIAASNKRSIDDRVSADPIVPVSSRSESAGFSSTS